MTTFTVDPATLQELSGTLQGVHSQMQNMHETASGYEGLLGGSDLEGEVGHFCSHWGYGIGQLGDHMSKVVGHLNDAAAGYQTSEQHIIDGARQAG
jgi:phage-related protein